MFNSYIRRFYWRHYCQGFCDSNRTRTYKYYTTVSVEDNDTLWSLADRYNNGDEDTASYINNIMQMNDLSSDTIHSGKNLVIYYYSTEIR